jgi:hypothetical protein
MGAVTIHASSFLSIFYFLYFEIEDVECLRTSRCSDLVGLGMVYGVSSSKTLGGSAYAIYIHDCREYVSFLHILCAGEFVT